MPQAEYADRLAYNRAWRRKNRARIMARRRGARLVVLYGPRGHEVGWLIQSEGPCPSPSAESNLRGHVS